MRQGPLQPEEYQEQACLLCMDREEHIPLRRIMEKLDDHFHHKDYPAVEKHLHYWLEEARACGDLRGEFALQNELMGYYRKLGRGEEAMESAEATLALVEKLESEGSVGAATACVNSATVYQAFGRSEQALELFRRAQTIYEKSLTRDDSRLGSLYNNMALAMTSLRRFDEAKELYAMALDVMGRVKHGELEQAMTHLNLADAAVAEYGPEAAEGMVTGRLEQAYELLTGSTAPRNGYYAFVCEKAAAAYGYYGWFLQEAELNRRAREIVERTGTES